MIEAGLKGIAKTTVVYENTAAALGSGHIEVFATPAMISLMEEASCNAMLGELEEGQSTVGTRIDVSHLAATPIGYEVTAESELVEVNGRLLTFKIRAFGGDELIGEGTHQRAIISVDRFLAKVNAKKLG